MKKITTFATAFAVAALTATFANAAPPPNDSSRITSINTTIQRLDINLNLPAGSSGASQAAYNDYTLRQIPNGDGIGAIIQTEEKWSMNMVKPATGADEGHSVIARTANTLAAAMYGMQAKSASAIDRMAGTGNYRGFISQSGRAAS